ncbi:LOW QUALITY PROTEIN: hypothetical protein PHMEG_0006871 [Phytophthora megakarya]|uniref:Uncharacterized protein n=1 Tax=Phytophthora megakarya TaxID=4795 RepID=A0A225WMU8_9STRA|nr:LOW QUALITY PROTEIN: hypothetical protein PHMEG_0006871 [Phytophthora megakarya]
MMAKTAILRRCLEDVLSSVLRIQINSKAHNVGRRKASKAKRDVNKRANRKWYEAGHKTAGDTTLESVLDDLDREKLDLGEMQHCLAGVLVKVAEAEAK